VTADEAAAGTDAVEVIAGFDGTHDGVAAEVVVVRRARGGDWFLAGTETVADEALVARLAGRKTAQALDVKTRRDAVSSWLNRHTGPAAADKPGLRFTDTQARQVGEVLANAISQPEINHG
jgi:hypothetical protein